METDTPKNRLKGHTGIDRGKIIRQMKGQIPRLLCADRPYVIRKIKQLASSPSDPREAQRLIDDLQARIQRSRQLAALRKSGCPDVSHLPALPICDHRDTIIQAIREHPVLIISGQTGSGKTTQIPRFCMAAGRGIFGKIGCTQPRRIAAMTVAERIAEEIGQPVGDAVGYKIRFQDRTAPDAYIKIMTDGILLTEAQTDRFLNEYDTIIVDEAHERSLNIDFILGILRKLIKRRRDLKLIITSATIDTEKFSKAFDNAPIIEVSGRLYPVEIRYQVQDPETQKEETPYTEMAAKAVDRIVRRNGPFGDILVFMPTEQDIRETCEMIRGRDYPNVMVYPLFARLSAKEQRRVFQKAPGRKIIVATNIAETSLTIPGIRYVVDSGLARISHYAPRSRTTSLPIVPISRSSADQRKGRCGRVQDGICIRLYPEEDYRIRPLYTLPEIRRANLAEVILRMISLRLGDISVFPFIDRPTESSIKDGYQLLLELNAIRVRPTGKGPRYHLTPKGKTMARLPLDPRLSAILIEAQVQGCLKEAIVITAALSIQDPRERPMDAQDKADQAQKVFADPLSDFVTLLNLWKAFEACFQKDRPTGRIKQFCRQHFLSFRRMREWRDIHQQIRSILRESGVTQRQSAAHSPTAKKNAAFSPLYEAIHKSILSGFLSNIAQKKEKNFYNAAKGKEVMLFPGSSLFNQGHQWIVAAELVETSRLFARMAASVDNVWLEEMGGSRCKSTYLHPHWERSRGAVVAQEQVSLFGLIIVPQRTVGYGRINPKEANEIFIRDALVEDDLRVPLDFMSHNRTELDEIRKIEARLRRRDILVHETDLFTFYQKRLPGIFDIRSLKALIKKKGGDHFLRMNRDQLFQNLPDEKELARFPESVQLGKRTYSCRYAFNPGRADDGVTVKIPFHHTASIPTDSLGWIVPGLFAEKIDALVRNLPKEYRKQLVPVAATVRTIVDEMPQAREENLPTRLSRFLHEKLGVDIPAAAWNDREIPEHLRMRIAVTDANGKVVRYGREPSILTGKKIPEPSSDTLRDAQKKWEKTSIETWDFETLPERIPLPEAAGHPRFAYPALVSEEGRCSLRLFLDEKTAGQRHRRGLKQLYRLHLKKDLAFLKKHLQLSGPERKYATYLGGPDRLLNQMVDKVIQDLPLPDIRSREVFLRQAETIARRLIPDGSILHQQVCAILAAYHQTRTTIHALESRYRNPAFAELFHSLRKEMENLVPETFIRIYEPQRLTHLPRYLEAVRLRAERATLDFEKDQKKAAMVQQHIGHLNRFLQDLSPEDTPEKRMEIENFFWMIQEFKVSLFAQELKTPFPVSAKKLNQKQKEIERVR